MDSRDHLLEIFERRLDLRTRCDIFLDLLDEWRKRNTSRISSAFSPVHPSVKLPQWYAYLDPNHVLRSQLLGCHEHRRLSHRVWRWKNNLLSWGVSLPYTWRVGLNVPNSDIYSLGLLCPCSFHLSSL